MILLEQHSEQPGALPRRQMTQTLLSLIGTHSRFEDAAEQAMAHMRGFFKAAELEDLMSCFLVEHAKQRAVVLETAQSVLQRTQELTSKHLFYMARFDEDNSSLAEEIWKEFSLRAHSSFEKPLFSLITHPLFGVRDLAARALCALCEEFPPLAPQVVENTLALYKAHLPAKLDPKDPRSFQRGYVENLETTSMLQARSGVASVIRYFGTRARTGLSESGPGHLLRKLVRFLANDGLGEQQSDLYRQHLEAGIELVKLNAAEAGVILPILEEALNRSDASKKDAAAIARHDQVQGACVVLLGTLAAFLDASSPSVGPIVSRLLLALHSNAESTQRAVSNCFVPLMKLSLAGRAEELLKQVVSEILEAPSERDRRGACYGLSGMIKGLGSSALTKYGIIDQLVGGLQNKRSGNSRQGALWAIEILGKRLGRVFERFVIQILPRLLSCFGDNIETVRAAAFDASQSIMGLLSPYGVQLVLPVLMKSLKDKNWRTQVGSIELLASMSSCAPKQLSFSLPAIVPKLCDILMDTKSEISDAARAALNQIGHVITNKEIKRHIPVILNALNEPDQHTRAAIEALMTTNFVHTLDAPSLALIMPILQRGLKERGTESKKKTAFIVGNLSSLSEARDLEPYLNILLPDLKSVLLDPIPEARAVASHALGALVRGLGESKLSDLIPWLRKNMVGSQGTIERAGAAQGLSEVVAALPAKRFEDILRAVMKDCTNSNPNLREGSLAFLSFLPVSFQKRLDPYLAEVLPSLINGLADSNENVRGVALRGAQAFTNLYGATNIDLLLGYLEEGLFAESWRIRDGSINLIGMLLKILAPEPQKTDYGALLGVDRKNKILAALYIAKSDVDLNVRNNAQNVWKDIIMNTPRTIREVIDSILAHIIASLAVDSDRRVTATKALAELADKFGEKVLDDIMGLTKHLDSSNTQVRLGAAIGLSEVMNVVDRGTVLKYQEPLTKAVRTAVCDPDPRIRQAAGTAFDSLARYTGNKTVTEVLSPLLVALEDPKQSKRAMEGLQQILSIKSDAVLPLLFPKLIVTPLTVFNAQALASIAKVVGPSIARYLDTVLPVFVRSSFDAAIRGYAEQFLLVIDEPSEAIGSLMPFLQTSELDKVRATQLLGFYCTHTEEDLSTEWHPLIQACLKLYCDAAGPVRETAAVVLKEICEKIPKEDLINFISSIRDAMNMLKVSLVNGGIPGFELPKALDPVVAVMVAGLRAPNPELRERAAIGVAEFIELTSEKALAPYVITITGPIIRAMGDRAPVSVKVALLSTIMSIMEKSGARLKPFVPQLQTTFLKALQDPSVDIRYHASTALLKLINQAPRIDPLIGELVSASQSCEQSIQEGMLRVLRSTILATGEKIGKPALASAVAAMRELIASADDRVRDGSAQVLSVLAKFVGVVEILADLLAVAPSAQLEHGSTLVIKHLASQTDLEPFCEDITAKLQRNLRSEQALLRVATMETLAALLSSSSSSLQTRIADEFLESLAKEVSGAALDIVLASLRCFKAFGKASPAQCEQKLAMSWIAPILLRVKDHANAVVKVAAERTLYYVLGCPAGSKVVQQFAAKISNKDDAKYVADLYKRVLSKFNPDSDNEGE